MVKFNNFRVFLRSEILDSPRHFSLPPDLQETGTMLLSTLKCNIAVGGGAVLYNSGGDSKSKRAGVVCLASVCAGQIAATGKGAGIEHLLPMCLSPEAVKEVDYFRQKRDGSLFLIQ